MNSPFWSLVMRYFLEFFSMVPCAVLCFLPVQDRLRRKPLNLFLTGIPLSILWAFAGGLDRNSAYFWEIYWKTMKTARSRSISVRPAPPS